MSLVCYLQLDFWQVLLKVVHMSSDVGVCPLIFQGQCILSFNALNSAQSFNF